VQSYNIFSIFALDFSLNYTKKVFKIEIEKEKISCAISDCKMKMTKRVENKQFTYY